MRKPNLYLVGAAKSATTSLYYYLKQHPDVYFNEEKKEFNYLSGKYQSFPHKSVKDGTVDPYDRLTVRTEEEFLGYFNAAKNEKYVGDPSTTYLYYERTADIIKAYNPDSKIIIMLRNPVDRAYSAYTHLRRGFQEHLSFEEGLAKEQERIQNNYQYMFHYTQVSMYYNAVKHYLDVFGRENVLVLLFEDLKNDVHGAIDTICNFLKINNYNFTELDKAHNASGIPQKAGRMKFFYSVVNYKGVIKQLYVKIIPLKIRQKIYNALRAKFIDTNMKKEPINPMTRQKLKELFKEDILKLQNLLERDLSCWL